MAIATADIGSVDMALAASFPAISCGVALPVGSVVVVSGAVPNNGHDNPTDGGCVDSQGNTYALSASLGSPTDLKSCFVWTSLITTALTTSDTITPSIFWTNIGQGASVHCVGIAVRGG